MKKTVSLLFIALFSLAVTAQTRLSENLTSWFFSRDSLHWQEVSVPHDWAISGPFDKKWDLQRVAIEQNGETEKTEKSGRSGALPWLGKGYYTTNINIPKGDGQRAVLYFDGAMAEPTVYVNGQKSGYWAYGYSPFRVDITTFVHEGVNRIDVSLENVEESSRWYPGAGLYRPVTLYILPTEHLDSWATTIRTIRTDKKSAALNYITTIANYNRSGNVRGLSVALLDDKGMAVANMDVDAATLDSNNGRVDVEIAVANPNLWSPETPYLYKLKSSLTDKDGNIIDQTVTNVGIRTIKVDSVHGFQLNGVSRKINGVCLHHDLGPLGAALNKAALIRQVKQLKDMGCNAIRTSHNPPSQMQMEVYDSLGMMVMAESFDMWIYPKCKNGYARFFKEWSDKDIEHLVLANHNHPSVIMWSIGNEIPEQWSYEGRVIAEHLQNLCHKLDPTRPVTQGMDNAPGALKSGFAQVMDIPGFNYRTYRYDQNMKELTTGFLLGSETASTISSRGVYKFPVQWGPPAGFTEKDMSKLDGQCSSYDVEWCPWSNLPEEDFMASEDRPYDIGQFVWTGYDYLGEPSPYDEYWPSRSSYFGIMDLAGLPKDRFYLYRSVWNKNSHTLHVLPHWTWPGREGQVTPVFVYTDYPSAELFVNGKSQGKISKDTTVKAIMGHPSTAEEAQKRALRYRLMWNNVKYEPGELKVVAYDADGQKAAVETIHTAGEAKAIKLETDRSDIKADGNDLAYITVSLVDADGNEVPNANDCIDVKVSGAGTFKAICNGDATSLEQFTKPTMQLFNGKLVVTVQASHKHGTINVNVVDKEKNLKANIKIRTS